MLTVLSHTSISSLTPPFDFLKVEDLEERDSERALYQAYAREMSILYFDLFVEYIQALIRQGTYSVDDAFVFEEVLDLFNLRLEGSD